MPDRRYDLVIVGGGIVGLSTAMEAKRRFPRLAILIVEKEDKVAQHQTGHNSGVIHSGIYYKPGSMKAQTCVAGAAAMIQFCKFHGIRFQICGKVIVATRENEINRLNDLLARGQANQVAGVRLLSREELKEIEPHCGGLLALHVPSAGITDYRAVAEKYAELFVRDGGELRTGSKVTGFSQSDGSSLTVETTKGAFSTRAVINCAGLHSDRVARLSQQNPGMRIVPFRGEYYDVVPERQFLSRGLIYPVPDPRFPFLGVHFTKRIHGGLDAGPNAVLAFKREGYRKTDLNLRDAFETLTYPGFWKMAAKHWRSGLSEFYRSFRKQEFVKSLQRLVPEISEKDLVPGGSGVRAQALSEDGSLVDDFAFVFSEKMIQVCNVPSPAATASLVIGQNIVEVARKNFSFFEN
ncbi:MAG TPA: L-2-hydroxyglutarate oxidase [Terriglobales bacterium]|nr:L-2-hydroxyglutarate oxidase [Terriglobales bacterium]